MTLLVGIAGAPKARADAVEEWETPPPLRAAELLGASEVSGEDFRIEPAVENDGLMNHYVVSSEYQTLDARGDGLALERAREQEAIVALDSVKTTDAYKQGLLAAAKAPLAVSRQALTDPGSVVDAVPDAVSNLWSDARGALGNLRKGSSSRSSNTQKMKEVLGYQRVRGRLAADFGVDVRSSNALLQEELDDVAWSVFAGGASVQLAMTQSPVAARVANQAARRIDAAQSPLWQVPASTLRQASAGSFVETGLAGDEVEAIAWHPTCTLTHQSRVAAMLSELAGVEGRDALARLGADAADETACRRQVETVRLAWLYHRHERRLARLRGVDGLLHMEDVAGRRVVALRADYVFWTPDLQPWLDALAGDDDRVLWVSGRTSARTRRELALRDIAVVERVFARHPETVDVGEALLPDRVDEDEEGDDDE